MSRHGGRLNASGKVGINPILNEFQNSCRVNGLQDDEEIADWATVLTKTEGEVRIVNRTINAQMAKILLRVFQRFQKLQKLCFYACYFEDPSFFTKFSTDLAKSSLSQLSFDFAPMTRDQIAPFLLAPNLDLLSLRGNKCICGEPGQFTQSMNTFYNNLAFSTLKCVDLSGCRIGDAGAIAIANGLFFNTSLRCINVSGNKIGDAGATAFAHALGQYVLSDQESEIQERLMNEESKQKISDEGGGLVKRKKGAAKPPAKKPPKPKKGQPQRSAAVRALSFDPDAPVNPAILGKWGSCETLDDGTKILPGNTTLTTLILDDNQITGIGFSKLTEMLRVNTHLVNFSVADNPGIDAESAKKAERRYVPPPPPQM